MIKTPLHHGAVAPRNAVRITSRFPLEAGVADLAKAVVRLHVLIEGESNAAAFPGARCGAGGGVSIRHAGKSSEKNGVGRV